MRSWFFGRIAQVKMILSLILVVLVVSSCRAQSGTFGLTTSQPAPVAVVSGVAGTQASYADLVSRVAPAVVTIRSTERARAAQQFPFMDDPGFREFFGDRLPQSQTPQRVQGVGSGVIVSPDGYILT